MVLEERKPEGLGDNSLLLQRSCKAFEPLDLLDFRKKRVLACEINREVLVVFGEVFEKM